MAAIVSVLRHLAQGPRSCYCEGRNLDSNPRTWDLEWGKRHNARQVLFQIIHQPVIYQLRAGWKWSCQARSVKVDLSSDIKTVFRKTGEKVWVIRIKNSQMRFLLKTSQGLWIFHLLSKTRAYFHVCLKDGATRIFSYLLCCGQELNLRQFSCTSLRDLKSGQFPIWATAAAARSLTKTKSKTYIRLPNMIFWHSELS